jgi:hypothetical protein
MHHFKFNPFLSTSWNYISDVGRVMKKEFVKSKYCTHLNKITKCTAKECHSGLKAK